MQIKDLKLTKKERKEFKKANSRYLPFFLKRDGMIKIILPEKPPFMSHEEHQNNIANFMDTIENDYPGSITNIGGLTE